MTHSSRWSRADLMKMSGAWREAATPAVSTAGAGIPEAHRHRCETVLSTPPPLERRARFRVLTRKRMHHRRVKGRPLAPVELARLCRSRRHASAARVAKPALPGALERLDGPPAGEGAPLARENPSERPIGGFPPVPTRAREEWAPRSGLDRVHNQKVSRRFPPFPAEPTHACAACLRIVWTDHQGARGITGSGRMRKAHIGRPEPCEAAAIRATAHD
ncbi:MAG: hypothetical protein JWO33_1012 [Caulobacteraceae bacterium]|nr:hypothetical protein [Caulobacteraceae bacterium]